MKRLATALVLLLSVALVPFTSASAVVKAGATCTKNNSSTTLSGYKFTCIKSGKKLVWSKGVKVSVPKPVPTTIPTPKGPAERITLNNLDPVWTSVLAFKEVNSKVIDFDSSQLNVTYIVGPGVDPKRLAAEKLGIDRIAGLWSPYFKPVKVRFIYVSENDSSWAENIAVTEGLKSMLYQSITLMITQNGCGFALGGRPNDIYTNIQCLATGQGLGNLQTGPHEYTHFFQYSNNSLPDYAPCWITEGMAHFYGNAVGYSLQDPAGDERLKMYIGQTYNYDKSKGNSQNDRTLVKIMAQGSEEKIIGLYKEIETPGGGAASSCYVLGGLAFEALTAVYGQEKIAEFMLSFKNSRDWQVNFLNSFNVDATTFYRKMTPYLAYWGAKML